MQPVQGIHHITAFAGDPQANVDFYHRVLGQSLKLPPWLEPHRQQIEDVLPKFTLNLVEQQKEIAHA